MQRGSSPLAALILATGIVVAALVLAGGLVKSRSADRYVTVKGIAERGMIGEATTNAGRAADSGSKILGIHRANQGVFEILPRDRVPGMSEENQIQKIVRVVTTVEYQLAD